jgi:(p)ppGpp synthase/HD superfamily hydrolase
VEAVVGDSDLIERAAALAAEVHAGDTRKGTDISYFQGHLQPVADLARGAGGTDVQVAAAYLHDAVEDGGGRAMLDRIRADFGADVATIVEDLSDSVADTTMGEAKPPWLERKQAYVDKLKDEATTSLEVSVADKLHNATCILEDYEAIGAELWDRFSERRPEAQLWYYTSLVGVFEARIPDHPLTAELSAVLAELQRQVLADRPDLAHDGPWPRPTAPAG